MFLGFFVYCREIISTIKSWNILLQLFPYTLKHKAWHLKSLNNDESWKWAKISKVFFGATCAVSAGISVVVTEWFMSSSYMFMITIV